MPWKIARDGDKWCVHKETADGGIGEQVACHGSEDEAKQQMAALYSSEPAARAVRMVDGSDDMLEGVGMPFGGPFNGQDLYGEHFSAKTDFAFPWFSERPALYHHGLDSDAGISVVGRVKAHEVKADLGVWTKVQLDKSSEYFAAIKDLVKQGKLFFSSGAMAHLVDVDKRSGEIKRWPWVELSLTPMPANLLATVDFATAKAHFKAVDLELPDSVKAELDADARNQLSDSDFAYIDKDGGRHLPIHDKAHVQNAMARFNQTAFESPDAKTKARAKIIAAAKRLGMEVSEDSMKATPSFSDLVFLILDDPGLDMEPVPIGFHAETVTHLAASLARRTKDLGDRRLKERRRISDASRKRFATCMEQMGAAMREMQTLLDSSMPAPKGTEGRTADMAMLRRQADSLRLFAATLPQN